jgi:hypothetical protein
MGETADEKMSGDGAGAREICPECGQTIRGEG